MPESTSFTKIGNLTKGELHTLYLHYSAQELDQILQESSGQEIHRFFITLKENQLIDLFKNLSAETINHIFEKIPTNGISKHLSLASNDNLKRIFASTTDNSKKRILKSISNLQRERLLDILPIKQKLRWKKFIDEELSLDDEYNTILSERIENSIEREALERIKNIELQIEHRQRQFQVRTEQAEQQLALINQQISDSEKRLFEQQKTFANKEKSYKTRESELNKKLEELKIEHDKQIQSKIEIKVPEYVENAIRALENKEKEYTEKAVEWGNKGKRSLYWALTAAIVAFIYGAIEFRSASSTSINWLFFAYLMLKGLIIIGILAAWAKHAFTQSNAYMHEALKRSERIHAISFGKLYLEIYGNNVDKQEMKSIFENWNMESLSAFKDIKVDDFQPKINEHIKDILAFAKEMAISNKQKSASEK